MILTDALFSPCRTYRYWLLRVWDETLPLNCFIGVNPSTADERENDPTIRKEIGFSERQGFGGLLMLNVGAYRATDPRNWRKALDPIGTGNTVEKLVAYAKEFGAVHVVAAWGKNGNYAKAQCRKITESFPRLWCLGKNPDGTPRHPLMLPYTSKLEPYV